MEKHETLTSEAVECCLVQDGNGNGGRKRRRAAAGSNGYAELSDGAFDDLMGSSEGEESSGNGGASDGSASPPPVRRSRKRDRQVNTISNLETGSLCSNVVLARCRQKSTHSTLKNASLKNVKNASLKPLDIGTALLQLR